MFIKRRFTKRVLVSKSIFFADLTAGNFLYWNFVLYWKSLSTCDRHKSFYFLSSSYLRLDIEKHIERHVLFMNKVSLIPLEFWNIWISLKLQYYTIFWRIDPNNGQAWWWETPLTKHLLIKYFFNGMINALHHMDFFPRF